MRGGGREVVVKGVREFVESVVRNMVYEIVGVERGGVDRVGMGDDKEFVGMRSD